MLLQAFECDNDCFANDSTPYTSDNSLGKIFCSNTLLQCFKENVMTAKSYMGNKSNTEEKLFGRKFDANLSFKSTVFFLQDSKLEAVCYCKDN